LLAATLYPLDAWIRRTVLILLILAIVHYATVSWSRRRMLFSIVLLACGPALAWSDRMDSIPLWLLTAFGVGLVLLSSYVLVLRHHLALLPLITAFFTALDVVREGLFHAYPWSTAGSFTAVLLLVLFASLWMRRLTTDTRRGLGQ
jgi:hypothetical protein